MVVWEGVSGKRGVRKEKWGRWGLRGIELADGIRSKRKEETGGSGRKGLYYGVGI
jgi:hypothetical protein